MCRFSVTICSLTQLKRRLSVYYMYLHVELAGAWLDGCLVRLPLVWFWALRHMVLAPAETLPEAATESVHPAWRSPRSRLNKHTLQRGVQKTRFLLLHVSWNTILYTWLYERFVCKCVFFMSHSKYCNIYVDGLQMHVHFLYQRLIISSSYKWWCFKSMQRSGW